MIEWIASGFLVAGGLFCLLAGIGVLRLGDIYLRMHASTKAGTLGLALTAIATMLLADTWINVAEVAFVFFFMLSTAPVGAHLIGRSAFRTHTAEVPTTRHDPECEEFRPKAPLKEPRSPR
jgi:multicomponent Na+:H+ antiporter subunit G